MGISLVLLNPNSNRDFGDVQVNLANDHRYMPQIVSSAIVNAPPPEGVIKTLHLCSQAHKNIDKATKVWSEPNPKS